MRSGVVVAEGYMYTARNAKRKQSSSRCWRCKRPKGSREEQMRLDAIDDGVGGLGEPSGALVLPQR